MRAFASARLAPNAATWDAEKTFPIDVLREAGELGLGGIYVKEDVGGSALSRFDAVAIFEELAKGDTTIAAYISIHNMVAWMIDAYGNLPQREQWLPRMVTMEHLGSYCLTEPGSGSDAAALSTRAARTNEGWTLDGAKAFISGAGRSDLYIAMVRTGAEGPGGISAMLVEDGTPGLSFGANERKMGWNAQPTRAVIFDNCRVPASQLVGAEGRGFRFDNPNAPAD